MPKNNRFSMHLNRTDWYYIHSLQKKFKERYGIELKTLDVIKVALEIAASMDDAFFDDIIPVPSSDSDRER